MENRSAVGEQYLDLQPRAAGGPHLADGDVIARDDTQTPLPVEKLLLDVDTTVRSVPKDALVTTVDELGTAFSGSGPDIARLIDSGDLLTRAAIEALPDTVALLRSGKTVLDTQRDTASQITTFSANLARISETVQASDPDLRVILDRGAVASKELEAVVRENDRALGTLLANLVTIGQVTSSRVDGIDQLLITYPEVVAGGYTVVPGDGTAHFGVQLTTDPPVCTRGYGGTEKTDPNRTQDLPPLNRDARCSLPRGSAATVRGAQNAPGAAQRRSHEPDHGLRVRPGAARDDGVRCSGGRRGAGGAVRRRPLVLDPGGGDPMTHPAPAATTAGTRPHPGPGAGAVGARRGRPRPDRGARRHAAARSWFEARSVESAQRDALAAGRQLAVNFATLDYRTVDADTGRVRSGATGEFLASYTKSLADLRSVVIENKSTSTVERAEAAVVSGDRDSASVIVGVVAPTTNSNAPEGEKKTYRMKLGLREVGGTWKVERLEFVG